MNKLFNFNRIVFLLSIILVVTCVSCEKKLIHDRQPVSDALFLKMSLDGKNAQINNEKGEVLVYFEKGKNLKNVLVKYIISTGSTMSSDMKNGSTIDLTKPYEVTITSMDKTTEKKYTIKAVTVDNQISEMYIMHNGSQYDADINQDSGKIILYVPKDISDYSNLKPEFKIADSATASIKAGQGINLSNGKSQIIVIKNHGFQKKYTITAVQFSIKLDKFEVTLDGKDYLGNIDQVNHTVKLNIPYTYSLTSLKPNISFSEGVSISPDTSNIIDFSNEVEYTLSSSGETVTYTVTASNQALVGFLSVWSSPSHIENGDEKEAYEWFSSTYSNGQFISMDDINNGRADLSFFKVLWWHNDEYIDLPQSAIEAAPQIKTFYLNGKGLFLTTFANRYLGLLKIPKDGKAPNVFSEESDPVSYPYGQGISINGHLNSPFFNKNVTISNFGDGIDRVYFVFDNTWRMSKQAVWAIGGADYSDLQDWKTKTGGIDLASYEWTPDRSSTVVMAKFPKNNKGEDEGCVVALGAPAYDWQVDHQGENDYVANAPYMIDNIKNITKNVIDYLFNQ